jgi:hypothetical protein
MKLKLFLLSLVITLVTCAGATAQNPSAAKRINYGASLPANCDSSSGEVYIKTSVSPTEYYYCSATNTWTKLSTGGGGGGGGVTSLGGQIGATQTFSKVDDTNVTLTIISSSNNHQFTLGFTGSLSKARQHAATVYTDQANTFGAFAQTFQAGANFVLSDPTDTSKKFKFDASGISPSTTRTVNVPDANSTTAQARSAAANQFLISMSAQGVFGAAQPAFPDLSGSLASGQDYATGVAANTYRSITVNTAGRVTGGTNPTTFSGYAVSDTSANLAAAITDETGSAAGGVLVFNKSPAILTPTIADFSNATHNHTNAAGGGQLTLSAFSSTTGSGAVVGQASPNLTTPNIGVATGTSLSLTGSLTSVAPAFTAPSLLNSWANYGSPFSNAGYLTQGGAIWLRGTIAGGTIGTTAFTLPSGSRPSGTIVFVCNSIGTAGILTIDSSGNVVPAAGSSGSFSLDCAHFIPQ